MEGKQCSSEINVIVLHESIYLFIDLCCLFDRNLILAEPRVSVPWVYFKTLRRNRGSRAKGWLREGKKSER